MWREVITTGYPDAELRAPVDAAAVLAAEERLGRPLPAALVELLHETDGVIGHHETDTVWTLDQIVDDNLHFRTYQAYADLYMPFDALLFFGDNGGGDQFAFVQTPRRPDVFLWEHETDSRRWVAGGLRHYLARSLNSGDDDWYR